MADPIENSPPVPDTPPANSGATQSSVRGIAALKKACSDAGLTSKYAICSLLGIAGVESKWIPIVEAQYSVKNLVKMGASQADAEKYARSGISPQEHFGFRYGTFKGKSPSEGQYFGRGFIQLTTRANYAAFGKLTGLDLINNPDLLIGIDDATMARCAKVSVQFLLTNVKNCLKAQWDPNFIRLAMHAVNPGDPLSSSGARTKIQYYEYFLGGKAADAPTNKDPTNTSSGKSASEIASASPTKKEAYSEDRSANFSTIGFTDPEGKYPLRDYMNEPDTNRLARGVTTGTNIDFKDASRRTGIPIANAVDGSTWDQPMSSYNTVYPLNKVFESESGHVLEFDDSPDGERINLYHKEGTFIEIDPNGSQINYIVGDGFYITENNGNIFINGTCNVTIASDLNLLCQGNANIEVNGEVDLVVHDDLNIGVAGDFNLAIGGEYNLLVEGNCNTQVAKTMNSRAIGSMSMESSGGLKLKTATSISMEGGDTSSTAETLMKMSSDIKIETSGSYAIKAKSFTLDIEDAIETLSNSILVNSKTTTQIATDSFQLETAKQTNISTGSFNTTTTEGALELTSKVSAIINSKTTSITSTKIDLNGVPIPSTKITPIPNKVQPLAPLGAPAQVVDFSGNILPNRPEEQVLVSTALSPVGVSNPNSLPEKAISEILQGSTPSLNDLVGTSGISGLSYSALSSVLGPQITNSIEAIASEISGVISSLYSPAPTSAIPDIYSTKFTGPMESKTSLSSAGGPSNPYSKLQVPSAIGASQSPHPNMVPPSRHTDPQSQYETPDDWATANGMAAANAMTSTSDYQNNVAGQRGSASASSAATGGTGNGKQLSADKLADINSKSDFPASYPLSAHFTLGMFVHSQGHTLQDTVLARGKSESSGPASKAYSKQQLVANLAALCENIMEPLYTLLGPCKQMGSGATWNITSGLRNEKTGSDHNKGRACDFQLSPRASIGEMYKLVVKLEKMLPYNQLIFEYRKQGASNWIHVSYSTDGNQGRSFTMCDDEVVNASGNPAPGSTGLFEFYT